MYPFQYSISTADMAPPTAPILLTGTVTDIPAAVRWISRSSCKP